MAVTSWTDNDSNGVPMDWTNPNLSDWRYVDALVQAVNERCFFLDITQISNIDLQNKYLSMNTLRIIDSKIKSIFNCTPISIEMYESNQKSSNSIVDGLTIKNYNPLKYAMSYLSIDEVSINDTDMYEPWFNYIGTLKLELYAKSETIKKWAIKSYKLINYARCFFIVKINYNYPYTRMFYWGGKNLRNVITGRSVINSDVTQIISDLNALPWPKDDLIYGTFGSSIGSQVPGIWSSTGSSVEGIYGWSCLPVIGSSNGGVYNGISYDGYIGANFRRICIKSTFKMNVELYSEFVIDDIGQPFCPPPLWNNIEIGMHKPVISVFKESMAVILDLQKNLIISSFDGFIQGHSTSQPYDGAGMLPSYCFAKPTEFNFI